MNIEWKEVNPDYIVSSDGQVGSRKSGRLKMLRQGTDGRGYPSVHLCANGSQRTCKVHRLVADAFLPPRPSPKHEINHKNGVRSDNRDTNLEWVTSSENRHHRYDVLHHGGPRGAANGATKLTEARVREVRARLDAGESQSALAVALGVSQRAISGIATRQTWGWLP